MGGIKKVALGAFVGLLSFSASTALAQRQSNFERNRNTSVLDRPRPLYDPGGLRLGGFTLKPKVDLGTEFNDNIFAQGTGKIDDIILTLRPDVSLTSNWSRHSLTVFGQTNSRFYTSRGNESTTDWNFGARGRLDIEQAKLNLSGSYGYFTEPRTSTNTSQVAAKPVRFYQATGAAQLSRDFNYVRLQAGIDYRDLDYKNAQDALGAFVLQDNRDYDMVTYAGRADLAISPDTAVFLAASYNDRHYGYRVPGGPLRDSDGWTAAAGVSFDLTNLIRGEVQIGYFRQTYKDAIFGSRKGLSGKAEVAWFPTQLTTVTVRSGRSVEETSDQRSSGFVSTTGGLFIDHELLRNVIISASAGYAHDTYGDIDRTDDRFTASLSGTYMMNRYLRFTIGYDYLDQRSKGLNSNPDYKVNRILVGAKVQY